MSTNSGEILFCYCCFFDSKDPKYYIGDTDPNHSTNSRKRTASVSTEWATFPGPPPILKSSALHFPMIYG